MSHCDAAENVDLFLINITFTLLLLIVKMNVEFGHKGRVRHGEVKPRPFYCTPSDLISEIKVFQVVSLWSLLNWAILPDTHEISVNLNKRFLPSHTTTTWPSPQHRQEYLKSESHNNCGHISSCSCVKGVLTDIDKKKTVRRRKWRQKTQRRTSEECFR